MLSTPNTARSGIYVDNNAPSDFSINDFMRQAWNFAHCFNRIDAGKLGFVNKLG
jgi:hypothetical protein